MQRYSTIIEKNSPFCYEMEFVIETILLEYSYTEKVSWECH